MCYEKELSQMHRGNHNNKDDISLAGTSWKPILFISAVQATMLEF